MAGQHTNHRPTIAIDIPTPRISNQHAPPSYFDSPAASRATTAKDSATREFRSDGNTKRNNSKSRSKSREKISKGSGPIHYQYPEQQEYEQQRHQQHLHRPQHINSRQPSEERRGDNTTPPRQQQSPGQIRTPSSGYYYGSHSGGAFQSSSPSGHSTYQTPPRHPQSSTNASSSSAITSKGNPAGTYGVGQKKGRTTSPGSSGKKHQYHSDNEYDYHEQSIHHDRDHYSSDEKRRLSSGGGKEEKKKNKIKSQQQQQFQHIHDRFSEEVPSPATIRTMDRSSKKHQRVKSASLGVAEMKIGFPHGVSSSSHRHDSGYFDMDPYHDDHNNNIGQGRGPIYSPPTPNNRKNRHSSSPERNPRHLNQGQSPSSLRQEEPDKHDNHEVPIEADNDLEDNASKKSRGLLSRASRKLKKRLVGGDKSGGKSGATSSSGGGGGKSTGEKSSTGDCSGDKAARSTMNALNEHREPKKLQPHSPKGGRDPSPERNHDEDVKIARKRHQRYLARSRRRDAHRGHEDGMRPKDEEKVVSSRHRRLHEEGSDEDEEDGNDMNDDVETSDDDDSTLSTNFSYEFNHVIITTPTQPLDPKLERGETTQVERQNHGHMVQHNGHFEDRQHQNQLRQHEMDQQQLHRHQLQRLFPPGSPPIMKKDPKYGRKDNVSRDHQDGSGSRQPIVKNTHQHDERREHQLHGEVHQHENQQKYENEMMEEIKGLREAAAKARQEKEEIEKKLEEMSRESEKKQKNFLSIDLQSKKISRDNSDKLGESSASGASAANNDRIAAEPRNVDDSNRSFAENQRRIHESLISGKLLKQPVNKSTDGTSEKIKNNAGPIKNGKTNLHNSLMEEMKSKFGSLGSLKHDSKETSEKSARWPRQSQPEDVSLHDHDEERRKLQIENAMLKKEVQSMKIKLTRERDDESQSTKTSVSEMKATVLKLQKEFKMREENHHSEMEEYEEVLFLKEQELATAMKSSKAAARDLESLNEFSIQLTNDLEAYKKECASYRERILQKERDVSKMEQMLFDERKKVLSLESENEMLLNLADEKIVVAADSEKSKQSEIDAYKDQCEKYRQRVIELERKIVTMESALESTGKIASSLDREKSSMSAKLDEFKKKNKALESNLRESAESLESFEGQVSSLKSKLTSLENKFNQAKTDGEEKDTIIHSLEIENGNLIQKLERQSKTLSTLQQSAEQCIQLEDEISKVKKENHELLTKQMQLKAELNSNQGTFSNASRMQKILSENESFISSLQKDLSESRNRHHQQFLEIRAKHSAEIEALTDKLSLEKKTRLEAEIRNNELEEKVRQLEIDRSELEHQYTNQKRNLNEQMMKVLEDHDELRKQLAENEDKNAALQEEMSNVSRSNERLVNDLRDSMSLLERQKSEMSDSLAAMEVEMLETRERSRYEIDALQKSVEERDRALATLRSELKECDKNKADKIEKLQGVIRDLERQLGDTQSTLKYTSQTLEQTKLTASRQTSDIKRFMSDFVHSMRMEKEGLMSDVQTRLLQEKAELSRHLKGIAQEYGWKMENKQMEQSMNHQMTITSIRSEAFEISKELKQRLATEQNKVVSLESSMDKLLRETNETKYTLNKACEKLKVTENELIERLEDIEVERAGFNSEIATLRLDLATLESTCANLEDDKENLLRQKQNLALSMKSKESDISRLEFELSRVSEDRRLKEEECVSLTDSLEQVRTELHRVRNQMSEAEADARDQLETGRGVIACLEKTMAKKENEWESCRVSLETEIDSVRMELKKAAEAHEENMKKQETTFESIILEKEEVARALKLQQIESEKKISVLEEQNSILKDQSVDLHAQYSCMENTLAEVEYESRTKAIMSEQEHDRVTAELNDCLGKLSFFQEDNKRLQSQLEEKVEAIRNLHELMQRNSQTKADELAQHYMKIEDELRNQLFAVQSEKDALTRKLTIQHKETDKLMDGFFQEKRELGLRVEALELEYQTLCEENDRLSDEKDKLAREAEAFTRTVDELKQKVQSLESCRETSKRLSIDLDNANERINELESEVLDANNEIDILSQKIEQALNDKDYALSDMEKRYEDQVDELQINHDIQLSKMTSRLSELEDEIEQLQNLLQDSRAQISFYEEEKLNSCKKLDFTTEKLTRYEEDNYELQTSVTFFQTEMEELESKLSNLEKDNLEKDSQIMKLKESLKHSLEEVLKLGESKRESLEKLAEITAAVSCVEEENEELKHSLMLSQSEAEREKSIMNNVVDLERQLTNCLSELEEAKLKRLEESNRALSEIESLQSKLSSLEREKREECERFEGEIAELESKLKNVEDLKMENEEALMKQINQLEAEKDAGNFGNDFIRELKARELQYEDLLHTLQTEMEQLKKDLVFLNDENSKLTRSKKDLVFQNNLLSEHIASLEDRLKSTIESMQAEINELDEKLSFVSEEKAEIEHTRDNVILQNDSLNETLSALGDQLESISSDEKKCQTLETNMHSMQTEIHRLIVRVNSLASEKRNLLHERNQILNQNDNLSKSLSSLEVKLQASIEEKDARVKTYEAKLYSMQSEIDVLNEELTSLATEKAQLETARDDAITKNDSMSKSLSALELALQRVQKSNSPMSIGHDDSSTSSSNSRESKVKLSRTIGELEATIQEIKKHHAGKIRFLQAELNEARKRLKKSERKVLDLSNLLEENAIVIATLHKKLTNKKKPSRQETSSLPISPPTE